MDPEANKIAGSQQDQARKMARATLPPTSKACPPPAHTPSRHTKQALAAPMAPILRAASQSPRAGALEQPVLSAAALAQGD